MPGRLRGWCAVLLVCMLALWPSEAAGAETWEGTHRFRVVVQGSVTSVTEPEGLSSAMPLEFRSTLHVIFDPPFAAGPRRAAVVLHDTTLRQGGTAVDLGLRPSGYTVHFDANNRPYDVEEEPELTARGVSLAHLLDLMYPVLPSAEFTVNQSWSQQGTRALTIADGDVALPIMTTHTVRELRSSGVAVVHSSVRGNREQTLGSARLTLRQLGSGVTHIDTQTLRIVTGAVTTDTVTERAAPTGPGAQAGSARTRSLFTTSIERLEDLPPTTHSYGPTYHDPAERFALSLPHGWSADPELLRGTTTLFMAPQGTARIIVEVSPQAPTGTVHQATDAMLDRLERRLDAFSVITKGAESTLGGESAAFTEYRYTEGVPLMEGALLVRYGGHHYIFQYADTVAGYASGGRQMLFMLAREFRFGPNPEGRVDPQRVLAAPTTLYESTEGAFAIEIPDLWSHRVHDDGSVAFAEVGDGGQLLVHTEPYDEALSAAELLHTWLQHAQHTLPQFHLLHPIHSAQLGPLSGAGLTYRSRSEADPWDRTTRVVAAPLGDVLYVVSIAYRSDGYDERQAIFERMLASFRPLDEQVLAQGGTQDALTEPAPPYSADHGILIGRVLHAYQAGDDWIRLPASRVRVEVSTGGVRAYARTDDAGYFYVANLPTHNEASVWIESVRGRLFTFHDDVDVSLTNLNLTTPGRVTLLGELTLTLDAAQNLRVQIDSGADAQGRSSVHLYFSERFAASPWAEIIGSDHDRRRQSP